VHVSVSVCPGVLVGIRVLKNFDVIEWEKKVAWVALAIYIVLMLIAVGINGIYTSLYPPTDWRACCPKPCSFYPDCH